MGHWKDDTLAMHLIPAFADFRIGMIISLALSHIVPLARRRHRAVQRPGLEGRMYACCCLFRGHDLVSSSTNEDTKDRLRSTPD